MADNYTTATVSPLIPASLCNSADLEMIGSFGFQWNPEGDDKYYFYASEYNEFGSLSLDDPKDLIRGFKQEYPIAFRPSWVSEIIKAIEAHDDQDYLEPGENGVYVWDVFQTILVKARETGVRLESIWIEGAHTSNRIYQGSHGGFCMKITENRLRFLGTSEADEVFDRMEKAAALLKFARKRGAFDTDQLQALDHLIEHL